MSELENQVGDEATQGVTLLNDLRQLCMHYTPQHILDVLTEVRKTLMRFPDKVMVMRSYLDYRTSSLQYLSPFMLEEGIIEKQKVQTPPMSLCITGFIIVSAWGHRKSNSVTSKPKYA